MHLILAATIIQKSKTKKMYALKEFLEGNVANFEPAVCDHSSTHTYTHNHYKEGWLKIS